MKKNLALYKNALYSYLVDPLFYASALVTLIFCSFRFFIAGKFFIPGLGSSDLRPLFISIPYISIITLPLLVLRLRYFINDDSLPLSPFSRFLSLAFSAFTAFAFPLLLLFLLPLSLSFFGSCDSGQIFAGFLGLFFYGFCAICLCLLFFSRFPISPAFSLILSALLLALVNFIHLLPLYFSMGDLISFLCKKISFAWHFDAFGKGILDSRNICYYIMLSLILILLSSFYEYRRLGKKISSLSFLLISVSLIFLSLGFSRIYFRIDLSKSRQFSVSQTSKNLISALDNQVRVTYFRSKELKNLYPQTDDVAEFLQDYCNESPKMTLTLEKADPQKLSALGLQAQQIRQDSTSKTEFVSVYSAILIQYLDKSTIIPFILSTQSLEYDLTQRLQQLLSQKERKVYLLSGNGRSLSQSYSYVSPWLSNRGFLVEELDDFNQNVMLENLTADDMLVIFGFDSLSQESIEAIKNALEKGTKAFIAASPFNTSIEKEWKISKGKNNDLIRYLNSKGFAFEKTLIQDISCQTITMASGEGSETQYVTMNYPQWLSIQSQREAWQGVTVFWACPLALYNDVKPVLYTSSHAWLLQPSQSESDLFLTDPFTLDKSAGQSGNTPGQYVVAAEKDNIFLVSDQFFLSSLLTGFISGDTIDFRNYDFLASRLLKLRGDYGLASLMEKNDGGRALYKNTDPESFEKFKKITIFLNFILPFIILSVIYLGVYIKRRKFTVI